MKWNITLLSFALTALLSGACASDGVPGIEGTIELSSETLIDENNARQIFIGAYGAEQLHSDGWPNRWADAKFSTQLTNLVDRDFRFSFVTGSSERLYVYAFLDQNGLQEDPANGEPNVVEINSVDVADVIGRYANNPVVPIDDMLQSIDIVLSIEMQR